LNFTNRHQGATARILALIENCAWQGKRPMYNKAVGIAAWILRTLLQILFWEVIGPLLTFVIVFGSLIVGVPYLAAYGIPGIIAIILYIVFPPVHSACFAGQDQPKCATNASRMNRNRPFPD
jgi:hypothetical protein